MEAVEIVVYITVAVMLGAMVLLVTMELASPQVYENIKESFFGEENIGFEIVDNSSITPYLFSFWEECNYGATPKNLTFQYTGEGLSKQELFSEIKRLRLCNTLSSAENTCGSREDLIINISSGDIEEGILSASCYREERTGFLRICKASGCEPAPEIIIPTNALCGSHNTTFPSYTNNWPSGSFCEEGVLEGSEPLFPEQGTEASWTCNSLDDGDDKLCSASRLEDNEPEPVDLCEDRGAPTGMTRADRCLINLDGETFRNNDCKVYDEVFGEFPGSTGIRHFAMDKNRFVAMEFSPEGFSENARATINIESFQHIPTYQGDPIMNSQLLWSISTCPGDFNKEKIEEELGPGCVLGGEFANFGFGFGGPGYESDVNRCALTQEEGTTYYLNIMYTQDDIATTPSTDLTWSCLTQEGEGLDMTLVDGIRCGSQMQMISIVGW